jgi:hypothetical protein
MSKLYNSKPKKRLKKVETINESTGEVGSYVMNTIDYQPKYPQTGYQGAYMKSLRDIVDFSKSAQRLFFAIADNTDCHNIIIGKWSTFTEDPPANISKAKRELEEHGFIGKIGKVWVLNPYIVLPKRSNAFNENQYASQRIWTRYMEDANAWYDGIDEDAKDLYGVEINS